MVKEYGIELETVDDKKENLNPDIVVEAIDIKKLNESITIILDKNSTILANQSQIIYAELYLQFSNLWTSFLLVFEKINFLGNFSLIKPLVFSLVPLCQGEYGLAK